MDIPSLSIQLSTAKANDMISVALLKKTLDTVEDNGESMIKMMEQSVTPNLGQNIDLRV